MPSFSSPNMIEAELLQLESATVNASSSPAGSTPFLPPLCARIPQAGVTPYLFTLLDAAAFAVPQKIDGRPAVFRKEIQATSGVPSVSALCGMRTRQPWSALRVDTGQEARVYGVLVGEEGASWQGRAVGRGDPVLALEPLLKAVAANLGPFTMPRRADGALHLTGSINGVLVRGLFPQPHMLRWWMHKVILEDA